MFSHHQYKPISFEQFHSRFSHFSQSDAKELFDYWLLDFYHSLSIFYRSKYIQYQRKVRNDFLRRYRLTDEDDLPHAEWLEHVDNSELPRLSHIRETESAYADQEIEEISLKRFGTSASDTTLHAAGTLLMRKIALQAPPDEEIWEIWFDLLINNPHQIAKALKWMRYPEYLETDHWLKVRDAMLLSYKAICQEENCSLCGESWYGNEPDIHTHHLSYENRGNERYRDLTLLCREHHNLWHRNERAKEQQTVIVRNFR